MLMELELWDSVSQLLNFTSEINKVIVLYCLVSKSETNALIYKPGNNGTTKLRRENRMWSSTNVE